jgi:hypothetical protein
MNRLELLYNNATAPQPGPDGTVTQKTKDVKVKDIPAGSI